MAFHVYPDPQINPLNVAAGATGPSLAIDQLTGVDPVTTLTSMFIRIAMSGASCGVAPAANMLGVLLQVSNAAGTTTGDAVELPPAPPAGPTDTVVIRNAPGAGGDEVNARIVLESNGVYLLTVFFVAAPPASFSNWRIRIRNKDVVAHDFTWVVASSNAESRQPWIDIADDLPYEALTTQSVPLTIVAANKGTGDLSITDMVGTALGANFTLTALPPGPIAPNGCGNLQVTFNAPAVPGLSTTNYTVGSNDTTAITGNPAATHNKQITLNATARMLEFALVLDASGSMEAEPNGTHPPSSVVASRWSKLRTAAKGFLDLLDDFGSGMGRFAVAVFPNVTITPAPFSSAGDVQAAMPLTIANVTTAKSALDALNPQWSGTPMGDGIAQAMGPTAGSFGHFLSDAASRQFNRRWMVLMSDGAHNGGPPDPPEYYGVGTGKSFRDKKVKAITVAYGDPGKWEVDHALLSTIATEAQGVPLDAGVDDDGLDLVSNFRKAITAGLSLNPLVDPRGQLTGDRPEARHRITITPFETKVAFMVNWGTYDADRLNVQLLTPNCELITAALASEEKYIAYHDDPRYKIFTIKDEYLRNVDNPAEPRYGVWTLIISSDGLYEEESENYDYEVISESRIRLTVEHTPSEVFTGDLIELAARLTVDGAPIPNANVSIQLSSPGQSTANWLAFNPVSANELAEAQKALEGQDVTLLQVKAHALRQKGVFFERLPRPNTLAMTYDAGQGRYQALLADTATPDSYEFLVTAIGQMEDGSVFRREQRLQIRVAVRPEPKFTLFDIAYSRIPGEEGAAHIAHIRLIPRDRFGNVLMIDPQFDPGFGLKANSGQLDPRLVTNLDGSYTGVLHYDPAQPPLISVVHGGVEQEINTQIAPVTKLHFVNEVVAFVVGAEAEKGANKFTNPRAALGSVYERIPDPFVALGGGGVLTVRIKDQHILAQGADDITIFVEAAADLRPYLVEVLVDAQNKDEKERRSKWVKLGESTGITQSFSLKDVGLKAAGAVRITDKSGRTRDNAFKPLDAPGVRIGGVGCQRIGKPPTLDIGEFSVDQLRGIKSREVKHLNRAEIKTIRQLIAAEPTTLDVDIELARRLDLHAKAVVSFDSVLELRGVSGLGEWSLWRINTTARAAVLAAAKAPAQEVDQLLEQVSAFRVSLRRKLLKQLTLAQLVGE